MSGLVIFKISLIFALTWLALFGMRRCSAALRHTVIVIALLAALMMPLFESVLPAWEVLPRPEVALTVAPDELTSARVESTRSESLSASPGAMPLAQASSIPWMFAGWLIGVCGLIGLLLVRICAMQLTVRRARPIDDRSLSIMLDKNRLALSIRLPVKLKHREARSMPAVWGLRRPVILLPCDWTAWPDTRRHDVLAHELAHVARGDVLLLTLAHLACALHWFNPLVWILKRRLCLESEQACDDLALAQGMPAPRYADHLLRTAADYCHQHSLAPVMAARSQLETRIMNILEKNKIRGVATLRMQAVIAVVAAVGLVPLTSLSWAQPNTMQADASSQAYRHSHSHQFDKHLSAIGLAGDDVDALLSGLGDTQSLTRAASAWALGNSDDPRAVDPLIKAAYDTDAVVRQWAVRSLEPWNTKAVASMLIDRLQDADAEVRQWAVRTLRRHDAAFRTQPLIDTLNDADAEVREWSVRVLAETNDPRVSSALAALAAVEENADVNEWIMRSLNVDNAQNVDVLVTALNNKSADVRQWAVRGLTGNKDEGVVDALISVLRDDDDEVREWSVRALAFCGNQRAVGPLQTMDRDSSADVREWVGHALREINC